MHCVECVERPDIALELRIGYPDIRLVHRFANRIHQEREISSQSLLRYAVASLAAAHRDPLSLVHQVRAIIKRCADAAAMEIS